MKVVIIEDEFNAQAALKKMLKLIDRNIEIIGEYGHVAKAIEQLQIQKPDLVFMDIQLEDGTGFDILDALEATT